jgi:hypothetical protein
MTNVGDRSAPASFAVSRPLCGNPSPASGRKASPAASQRERQPVSNRSKAVALTRQGSGERPASAGWWHRE